MIYLDTNAFFFFFFRHESFSSGIEKIFQKIERGKYKAITSCLTLDEFAYVVLMKLIEDKYKKHPKDVLREKPGVIIEFVDEVEKMFDVIYSLNNLEIVDVNFKMMKVVPPLMRDNLLLPRDCVHLQTMRDHDCRQILSTDPDFDRVEGIERIKPEEI